MYLIRFLELLVQIWGGVTLLGACREAVGMSVCTQPYMLGTQISKYPKSMLEPDISLQDKITSGSWLSSLPAVTVSLEDDQDTRGSFCPISFIMQCVSLG